MLKFMRDQRWVAGAAVTILGVVFIFFMAGGNPRGANNTDAFALVGEIRIDLREFARLHRQQEDYIRTAMGDRYNAEESRSYVDQLTISELIRNALFQREGKRLGLRVSDEEIRAQIRDFPGMRDADGSFSQERFLDFAERGYGTERNFVESVRRDLLAEKTRNMLVLSFGLSDAEVRDALRFELDQVRLLIANIPNEIDPELKFGDEEIAEVVGNQEERLRTLYQDKIGEYELPERVEARHILIRTPPMASDDDLKAFRERIEAIRQRIIDGEDFVEVAKVESQDTGAPESRGEVNTFRRGENLPKFEKAVFNSTPGELSEVLETSVGLIIFYTEAILPAESNSYEDVSSELAQQALAQDAAAVEAEKLGAELLALIENGSNLEDAARGLELSIERTGLFSRRGDYHIPTLGKSEEMMEFVFAAKEGDITPITEIDGGIFIAQVVEHPSVTDESLEERLPQEKGRLLNAKRTEALTAWLQRERTSLESQGQLIINEDMLGSGG